MTCLTKSSIKEILHWLNVNDPTCTKKVLKFNRILRLFYTHTYLFRQNIISESVSTTAGTTTKTLQYPINKVWWFFGKGDWPCFEKIETNCVCCGEWNSLIMMNYNSYDEGKGKYKILWENEIKYTLPCDASEAYVVYSRWPIQITSICDVLEIDQYMLTGLEFLIEWFYERRENNTNRQQLVQSDYFKWLEEARTTQQERIDYIGK